jgi:hypothetical protein
LLGDTKRRILNFWDMIGMVKTTVANKIYGREPEDSRTAAVPRVK